MKKLLVSTTIISVLALSQPVLAHEGEDHSKTEQHGQHESSDIHTQAEQINSKDSAMRLIRDGVMFMDEAVKKNQVEL